MENVVRFKNAIAFLPALCNEHLIRKTDFYVRFINVKKFRNFVHIIDLLNLFQKIIIYIENILKKLLYIYSI